MKNLRRWIAPIILACFCHPASAADFLLNVTADDATSFYDYFSDAFARIDLRDPPPNEFRQRMHSIPNPSVSYGAIDLFPHDNAMRFGSVSYDESSLVSGTGTANVMGLTLDLLKDPFNATYENWKRFPGTTEVTNFQGTIDVVNGVIASCDLTVDVKLHFPSIYGATIEGVYAGQLTLTQDTFNLNVEGSPFLDVIFNPAGENVHFGWFWSGTIDSVVFAVPGDLSGDLFVGQDDLNLLLGSWGQAVVTGSVADPSQDGFVGQDDLNIVLAAWGKGTPPLANLARAVPEVPSTLLLSTPLAVWAVARRLRRAVV